MTGIDRLASVRQGTAALVPKVAWAKVASPKIAPAKIAWAAAAAVVAASSLTVFAGARDLDPPATFAERFPIRSVPTCSIHGWPYLDSRCLHRHDGSAVRPVRIIAIDRTAAN